MSVARSTVSTGLRELHGWGIVRVVHVLGDRRDHFEAMSDVWEMFRAILTERKRREMDPTLAVLRESVAERLDTESEGYVENRVQEMLDFFETATTLYDQVSQMSTASLTKIARSLEGNLGEVLKVLTKG